MLRGNEAGLGTHYWQSLAFSGFCASGGRAYLNGGRTSRPFQPLIDAAAQSQATRIYDVKARLITNWPLRTGPWLNCRIQTNLKRSHESPCEDSRPFWSLGGGREGRDPRVPGHLKDRTRSIQGASPSRASSPKIAFDQWNGPWSRKSPRNDGWQSKLEAFHQR